MPSSKKVIKKEKNVRKPSNGSGKITRRIPRMLEQYKKDVAPVLMRDFGYKNPMQIPRLQKIVVNMGVGEATQDRNALGTAVTDLTTITGQKPRENKAKKSVANFKLREGVTIGTSVTLRSTRMWDFFDRFVNIALPRIRDFRGINPNAFDGNGNYSIGLSEQVTFPEISYTNIDRLRGLQIVVVTTAKSDEESKKLLELLGMPFVKIGQGY